VTAAPFIKPSEDEINKATMIISSATK